MVRVFGITCLITSPFMARDPVLLHHASSTSPVEGIPNIKRYCRFTNKPPSTTVASSSQRMRISLRKLSATYQPTTELQSRICQHSTLGIGRTILPTTYCERSLAKNTAGPAIYPLSITCIQNNPSAQRTSSGRPTLFRHVLCSTCFRLSF